MSKNRALIFVHLAMLLAIVIAAVGLGMLEAKDDLVVAVIMFIGCGGAFAISEVVAYYARRDERSPRGSHNPPASG